MSVEVEVVRSSRRRKTAELRPTPNGVRITIPARSSVAEERHLVATLLKRYERKRNRPALDLEAHARSLARAHGLKTPTSIRWVDNQNSRWGSCTPQTGAIRISSAVGKFPQWVIDYVIVHELAHLSALGHGKDFWNLVNGYPLTERARGFLIAKGADLDETNEAEVASEVDSP